VTEILSRPVSLRTPARRSARFEHAASGPEPVPAWRGISHEKAFALAPALGFLLFATAGTATAHVAAAIFAVTMTCMLGASALNHRARLGTRWEHRFRRADHIAILVFLGGTWTSVALVVLSGGTQLALTAAVWAAVLLAAALMLAWLAIPGWLMAAVALALSWPPALVVLPHLRAVAGTVALALFVAGGIVYTVGAAGYAVRRPNLHPAFGFHEVFHALVLVGAACHYLTLALFVLAPA
jgi:hemolysin III